MRLNAGTEECVIFCRYDFSCGSYWNGDACTCGVFAYAHAAVLTVDLVQRSCNKTLAYRNNFYHLVVSSCCGRARVKERCAKTLLMSSGIMKSAVASKSAYVSNVIPSCWEVGDQLQASSDLKPF